MRVCVRPGCEREIPAAASETRVYCEPRCRTAHWREKRETPKRVKPSGRQVSYRKAVRAMTTWLVEFEGYVDPEHAEALAESALSGALPERQRTTA